MAAIAQKQDVFIDTTTQQRWRDVLGLLREFDTLVDEMDMPADDALHELITFNRFANHYPNLAPPHMPDETRYLMTQRVEKILYHGTMISSTRDAAEFVYHRQEEVDHTAELLADCATADTTLQLGFYTKFMPILRNMGRAANYIDTLIDYRQDRREAKVSIAPTPQFFKQSAHALLLT